jgi:hypothetical protein
MIRSAVLTGEGTRPEFAFLAAALLRLLVSDDLVKAAVLKKTLSFHVSYFIRYMEDEPNEFGSKSLQGNGYGG